MRKTKFLLVASHRPPSQPDQYFYDNITKIQDRYAHSYQKVIFAGDFNAQENEICVRDFIRENNLKNIVKEPACFKNPVNPSCIDLFLTNTSNSFQGTKTVSTGLSDFHKMVLTVLKNKCVRLKPKEIHYRYYRNFNREAFRQELKSTLSEASSYEESDELYLMVFNRHVLI